MKNLNEHIDRIDLKVRQLIQKIELIKRENKALLEENSLLKQSNQQLESQLKLYEESATTINKTEDDNNVANEELRAELELYIQEIDNCIEMLNG